MHLASRSTKQCHVFHQMGWGKKVLGANMVFLDEINYITLIDRLNATAFPAHKSWPCDVSLKFGNRETCGEFFFFFFGKKHVVSFIPQYHIKKYCYRSEAAFEIDLVLSISQTCFFIALMPIDGLKELGGGFGSWYWSSRQILKRSLTSYLYWQSSSPQTVWLFFSEMDTCGT